MDGPHSSAASGTATFLDCPSSSWPRVRPTFQMGQLLARDARPGLGATCLGPWAILKKRESLRGPGVSTPHCGWLPVRVFTYTPPCYTQLLIWDVPAPFHSLTPVIFQTFQSSRTHLSKTPYIHNILGNARWRGRQTVPDTSPLPASATALHSLLCPEVSPQIP